MDTLDPAGRCDADPTGPRYGERRLRGWRRFAAVTAAILAAVVVATWGVASRQPDYYHARREPPGGETAARRLVSDASAFHASLAREGRWEAAFSEDDVNAWLAIDLPRNHGGLLPAWASDPRVRFRPRQIDAAVRIGRGVVAAVTVELVLREPNQLGIVVDDARLGALPLPRGLVLGAIRRRLEGLGLIASVRRLDDRNVLVVYIPSTPESGGRSLWLESLAVGDGTLACAGRTESGHAPSTPPPAGDGR